jgi:EGF domain/Calcium-binding EGF domain
MQITNRDPTIETNYANFTSKKIRGTQLEYRSRELGIFDRISYCQKVDDGSYRTVRVFSFFNFLYRLFNARAAKGSCNTVCDTLCDHKACMDDVHSDNDVCQCLNPSTDFCDENATCDVASDSCVCHQGFVGDGKSCFECSTGFTGVGGKCADIDECNSGVDKCSIHATCENNSGSFTCKCKDGFSGDGMTCADIDECAINISNSCSPDAECRNIEGSFECICNMGFSGDGIDCNDIDECSMGLDNCSIDAICENTVGSYNCTCNTGYEGDGITCTDIDECTIATANYCSSNADCKNVPGSLECSCKRGFSGDGIICNDIDECATEEDNCSSDAACTNTAGGFTCQCKDGFLGDGVVCTDIDECGENGVAQCSSNGVCVNTPGSYSCVCNSGFEGDGMICNDIDECLDPNICPIDSTCRNSIGSFECKCIAGAGQGDQACAKVYYEDVPDISDADTQEVMKWIKVEVVQERTPFCWKATYGRGAGLIPTECPSNKEKIGLLCYSYCPSGYVRFGVDCHSVCPDGLADQGLFCRRLEYGRGGGYPWHFGDCLCNDGMIGRCEYDHGRGNCEMWGAIAYPKCDPGYSPFGCCICRPNPPDCSALGLNPGIDLSCAKKIIIGDPTPMICASELQYDAGLCYPYCTEGYYNVGPVCWSACDSDQTDCAAACAKDTATCALGITEQILAPLIVAANILTLGLATPITGAITISIKTASGATKLVSGATRLGKIFVDLVKKFQTIRSTPSPEKATIFKRIFHAATGNPLRTYTLLDDIGEEAYDLLEAFQNAFAADFAGQTSPEINDTLDTHFHPMTALYFKKLWALLQFYELAQANDWEIANLVLGLAAIADPTGIASVVAAYAKPTCSAIVPLPCISADIANCIN